MANSSVVGLLRVLFTADTAQFHSGLREVQTAAGKWQKDLASIGRTASTLGTQLTATVTLPLVGLAAAAIKAGTDFESSFANVAKTVDGVSDSAGVLTDKGRELALAFRQMAKEIPVTTSELNAIAALGGQMGVPIEQLATFTRHVAALGVAVDGISTEAAAAGLAQIGNIFGEGTTRIAEMASALVHLGNSSNATEADILEFSKRLAGAGNAVGMSIPEVMALGTAMANVGINAEAGGTAMSQMIAKMSMAVSTGGESLKVFDALVESTGEKFATIWKRSPIEAIDAVVKGLGAAKSAGHDLNLVVGAIGATNVRSADTMKRLAGAGDGVAASLVTANEGFKTANKHLEEFDKKAATTKNQLKILWSQIYDVGITLFDTFKPGIMAAIEFAKALVPHLDKLAHWFGQLPGGIQLFVMALGGIAAAAGPVLYVVGQLVFAGSQIVGLFAKQGLATRALTWFFGLFGGWSSVVGALSRAMTLFTGPIGWIVGAAAGILTATGTWDELFRILRAGAQIILNIVIGAFTGLVDIGGRFLKWVGGLAMAVAEFTGLNVVLDKLGQMVGWVGRKFAEFMGWLAGKTEQWAGVGQAIASTEAPITGLGISLATAQQGLTGVTVAAKDTGVAVGSLTGLLGKNEDATKAAAKAAKDLAQEIERERQALSALGLVTSRDVNEKLEHLAMLLRRAEAEGVDMHAFLEVVIPSLEEFEKQAKASGANTGAFSARLRELKGELSDLHGAIPTLTNVNTDPLKLVITGMTGISEATIQASKDTAILSNAQKLLGASTRAELERTARDMRRAYNDMVASGQFTAAELKAAREKVLEAERRAAGETVSIWRTQIFPAVSNVIKTLNEAITGSFAQMLLGAKSFRDGFVDIWNSIKAALLNIFNSILQSFIKTLLDGMMNALLGRQGGLGAALGGLFGGFGKAGATGAFVDSAVGGVGAGLGGGGGAGAGGLLGGLGAGALGLAIGYGIFKGFFDNPHRPWDALTGQEEAGKFFEQFGGEDNFRKFLESLGFAADEIDGLVAPLKDEIVLGIRSSFDAAIAEIRDAIRGAGIDITDAGFSVPHLASGGIVHQPTLAVFGEAGPEAVIPLERLDEFGIGHGSGAAAQPLTVNATFNISTIDGKGVKEFVESRDFAESLIQSIQFNTLGLGSAIRGVV